MAAAAAAENQLKQLPVFEWERHDAKEHVALLLGTQCFGAWKAIPGAAFTELDKRTCSYRQPPAPPPAATPFVHTVLKLPDTPPGIGGGRSTVAHHFRLAAEAACQLNQELLDCAARMIGRCVCVCHGTPDAQPALRTRPHGSVSGR